MWRRTRLRRRRKINSHGESQDNRKTNGIKCADLVKHTNRDTHNGRQKNGQTDR